MSRAAAALLAAGAVVATIVWALSDTYPNYDSYYHLVWGRELLHGVAPTVEAYQAPTQHPLWIAAGALLSLAGQSGERLLVLVCLLSLAALVAGVYALGEALFGRRPALAAAVFTAASASLNLYALRGYVDVPFLALVVWAGALESRRALGAAGSPWAAMALLAVAGLLRPEAWLLAALYWAWSLRRASPGARIVLTVLAAAAPLAWAAVDLALTGDPLYSLHATSGLAEELGRERGLDAVPGSFVSFLADTVRPPVAVLGALGLGLALWRPGARAAIVPLALFAAGAATFVAAGVAGLSILPRYLTVPAVALCVFAGYALLGFTTLAAEDPLRRPWARAATGAGVVGLLAVVLLAPSVGRVRTEVRFIRDSHRALAELLERPRLRAALVRCGPLSLPNYRLVPDSRWLLDAPRGAVTARSARRRPFGVALFPLGAKGLARFGFADGASPRTTVPDPGYRPLERNDLFSAYVRCPG